MRYANWCAGLLGFALLLIVSAGSAQAQATRTWVSGVGNDADPCSRTAPCKTFAGAISKTAANGEINCIDPGGFGAVTITKSIAIICDNTEAGVLVSGTNGIVVNPGAGGVVLLSGLDLEGLNTGLVGINFLSGATLHVRNSIIRGFRGGAAVGIQYAQGVSAELKVTNSLISENGTGGTGGGIVIVPTASAVATVSVSGVHAFNNVHGFKADTSGTTATVNMTIVNSTADSNDQNGVLAIAPVGSVKVMVDRSSVVNNASFGIRSNGGNAIVRISNNTITGNTTAGLSIVSGATVASYGNNNIDGNGSDLPLPSTIPQH